MKKRNTDDEGYENIENGSSLGEFVLGMTQKKVLKMLKLDISQIEMNSEEKQVFLEVRNNNRSKLRELNDRYKDELRELEARIDDYIVKKGILKTSYQNVIDSESEVKLRRQNHLKQLLKDQKAQKRKRSEMSNLKQMKKWDEAWNNMNTKCQQFLNLWRDICLSDSMLKNDSKLAFKAFKLSSMISILELYNSNTELKIQNKHRKLNPETMFMKSAFAKIIFSIHFLLRTRNGSFQYISFYIPNFILSSEDSGFEKLADAASKEFLQIFYMFCKSDLRKATVSAVLLDKSVYLKRNEPKLDISLSPLLQLRSYRLHPHFSSLHKFNKSSPTFGSAVPVHGFICIDDLLKAGRCLRKDCEEFHLSSLDEITDLETQLDLLQYTPDTSSKSNLFWSKGQSLTEAGNLTSTHEFTSVQLSEKACSKQIMLLNPISEISSTSEHHFDRSCFFWPVQADTFFNSAADIVSKTKQKSDSLLPLNNSSTNDFWKVPLDIDFSSNITAVEVESSLASSSAFKSFEDILNLLMISESDQFVFNSPFLFSRSYINAVIVNDSDYTSILVFLESMMQEDSFDDNVLILYLKLMLTKDYLQELQENQIETRCNALIYQFVESLEKSPNSLILWQLFSIHSTRFLTPFCSVGVDKLDKELSHSNNSNFNPISFFNAFATDRKPIYDQSLFSLSFGCKLLPLIHFYNLDEFSNNLSMKNRSNSNEVIFDYLFDLSGNGEQVLVEAIVWFLFFTGSAVPKNDSPTYIDITDVLSFLFDPEMQKNVLNYSKTDCISLAVAYTMLLVSHDEKLHLLREIGALCFKKEFHSKVSGLLFSLQLDKTFRGLALVNLLAPYDETFFKFKSCFAENGQKKVSIALKNMSAVKLYLKKRFHKSSNASVRNLSRLMDLTEAQISRENICFGRFCSLLKTASFIKSYRNSSPLSTMLLEKFCDSSTNFIFPNEATLFCTKVIIFLILQVVLLCLKNFNCLPVELDSFLLGVASVSDLMTTQIPVFSPKNLPGTNSEIGNVESLVEVIFGALRHLKIMVRSNKMTVKEAANLVHLCLEPCFISGISLTAESNLELSKSFFSQVQALLNSLPPGHSRTSFIKHCDFFQRIIDHLNADETTSAITLNLFLPGCTVPTSFTKIFMEYTPLQEASNLRLKLILNKAGYTDLKSRRMYIENLEKFANLNDFFFFMLILHGVQVFDNSQNTFEHFISYVCLQLGISFKKSGTASKSKMRRRKHPQRIKFALDLSKCSINVKFHIFLCLLAVSEEDSVFMSTSGSATKGNFRRSVCEKLFKEILTSEASYFSKWNYLAKLGDIIGRESYLMNRINFSKTNFSRSSAGILTEPWIFNDLSESKHLGQLIDFINVDQPLLGSFSMNSLVKQSLSIGNVSLARNICFASLLNDCLNEKKWSFLMFVLSLTLPVSNFYHSKIRRKTSFTDKSDALSDLKKIRNLLQMTGVDLESLVTSVANTFKR